MTTETEVAALREQVAALTAVCQTILDRGNAASESAEQFAYNADQSAGGAADSAAIAAGARAIIEPIAGPIDDLGAKASQIGIVGDNIEAITQVSDINADVSVLAANADAIADAATNLDQVHLAVLGLVNSQMETNLMVLNLYGYTED